MIHIHIDNATPEQFERICGLIERDIEAHDRSIDAASARTAETNLAITELGSAFLQHLKAADAAYREAYPRAVPVQAPGGRERFGEVDNGTRPQKPVT